MSELLQDVLFYEEDDKETHFRKLRILQDEVIRIQQTLGQLPSVEQDGALNLRAPVISPTAGASAGFINVTVNGVEMRLAVAVP